MLAGCPGRSCTLVHFCVAASDVYSDIELEPPAWCSALEALCLHLLLHYALNASAMPKLALLAC